MSKTTVVILHYYSSKDTIDCLQSLIQEDKHTNYSIIVVFNSQDARLSQLLKMEYPGVIIILNRDNIGFAGGVNRGIVKAEEIGSENIIILNNDTIISEGLISGLVAYANKEKTIGLVSPKIYFSPGFEYHKNRYKTEEKGKVIWYGGGMIDWLNIYGHHRGVDEVDKGQYNKITETDYATGCCMLIKKSVIDKIGYFNEKYFLYFEDVDYSVRTKEHGFKVFYYPKTYIWHKNASSSDKPGSLTHIYYQNRNRLYFGYKYASWRAKKALLFDSMKMLLRRGIQSKAVRDYYFGLMGKRKI